MTGGAYAGQLEPENGDHPGLRAVVGGVQLLAANDGYRIYDTSITDADLCINDPLAAGPVPSFFEAMKIAEKMVTLPRAKWSRS